MSDIGPAETPKPRDMGSQGGGSGESLHYQIITKSNTAQPERESAIELFAELLGRGFRIRRRADGETVISPRNKLTSFDRQRIQFHQRAGHITVLAAARGLIFEAPWAATAALASNLSSSLSSPAAAVVEVDLESGIVDVRGDLDDSRRVELDWMLATIREKGRLLIGIPSSPDSTEFNGAAPHGSTPLGWIGLPAAPANPSPPPVIHAQPYFGGLCFYCEHCRRYHYHGEGEGHRVAHCISGGSPYLKTGYVLVIEPKDGTL